MPGPSNSWKFLGVLGDPYDLPNSSGLATIWTKTYTNYVVPVARWPYKVNTPRGTCQRASEHHGMPWSSKLQLFLMRGSLRVFAGDLRKFAGVLPSKWIRFFCTAQLWTAAACFDKLAGCIKSFTPAILLDSIKGREQCNSVVLGVSGVSGFCGKKCYDFPSIQSKAETAFFFRRTKVQVFQMVAKVYLLRSPAELNALDKPGTSLAYLQEESWPGQHMGVSFVLRPSMFPLNPQTRVPSTKDTIQQGPTPSRGVHEFWRVSLEDTSETTRDLAVRKDVKGPLLPRFPGNPKKNRGPF